MGALRKCRFCKAFGGVRTAWYPFDPAEFAGFETTPVLPSAVPLLRSADLLASQSVRQSPRSLSLSIATPLVVLSYRVKDNYAGASVCVNICIR